MLARALNKWGWSFLKNEEKTSQGEFCSQFNVTAVPEIFNIFLADIFPIMMKEF